MSIKSVNFLGYIYKKQAKKGDYVFLTTRNINSPLPNKNWLEHPIKYNKDTIKEELTWILDFYPPETYDIYFSPMSYSKPRRKKEFVNSSCLFAQDIDEHTNPLKITPKPSYLWESSQGRFVGLWETNKKIGVKGYTMLNKALAKKEGFDDCYDMPHVYRVPFTRNHKYKGSPLVKRPIKTNTIHDSKQFVKDIGYTKAKTIKQLKVSNDAEINSIINFYKIPADLINLINMEYTPDLDRSKTLWYVGRRLLELNIPVENIIYLLKDSVLNKFKGRPDETLQLAKAIQKMIIKDINDITPTLETDEQVSPVRERSFKVTSFAELMKVDGTEQGWLVKDVWAKNSHGIIAGSPKVFKSTLAYDLAISVASGKDFLGKYPVETRGDVVIFQNENNAYNMKDRAIKMMHSKGLSQGIIQKGKMALEVNNPDDLPIHYINQQGIMIDNADTRLDVEEFIKDIKPVLIIFDPLYLMVSGELNSATEMRDTLSWLLSLKTKYKTSVIVVHHYNKSGNESNQRGGNKILGSQMFYSWLESAWYLDKDKQGNIIMQREFREYGEYPNLKINIQLGEIGDNMYKVSVSEISEDVEDKTPETKPTHSKPRAVNLINQKLINCIAINSNDGKPNTLKRIIKLSGLATLVVKQELANMIKSKQLTRGDYNGDVTYEL